MSYRELTARAARMAYKDAGISTEDLDGAVVAEEDFTSGYSICDEYTPDQLGVVRKAVYRPYPPSARPATFSPKTKSSTSPMTRHWGALV
jgi:hypothetical protein